MGESCVLVADGMSVLQPLLERRLFTCKRGRQDAALLQMSPVIDLTGVLLLFSLRVATNLQCFKERGPQRLSSRPPVNSLFCACRYTLRFTTSPPWWALVC